MTAAKGKQKIAIKVGAHAVALGDTVKVQFCSHCLSVGHCNDECPIRQCFHCGLYGHVERDCFKKEEGKENEESVVFRNFRKGAGNGGDLYFNRRRRQRSAFLRGKMWKRACRVPAGPPDVKGPRDRGLFFLPKMQKEERPADATADAVRGRTHDQLLQLPGVRQHVEDLAEVSSRVPARDVEEAGADVVLQRRAATNVR